MIFLHLKQIKKKKGGSMELPKLINNINERVVDDLKNRLSAKSKVSIAAASFPIYAFEALKNELEEIEDLRFIFHKCG